MERLRQVLTLGMERTARGLVRTAAIPGVRAWTRTLQAEGARIFERTGPFALLTLPH